MDQQVGKGPGRAQHAGQNPQAPASMRRFRNLEYLEGQLDRHNALQEAQAEEADKWVQGCRRGCMLEWVQHGNGTLGWPSLAQFRTQVCTVCAAH